MEGNRNPYITDLQVEKPRRKYNLTVIDEAGREHKLVIDPEKIPYEDHGLPGSILDICMGNGIELDHACGGVCACSTCHVHVIEGLDSCNEPTDSENDMIDEAYDVKHYSRLGCQCVPNGTKDVVVRIPAVNRNLVREPHGTDSMSTKQD
ncbi:MAG: 2Fe-2S iron-sulfur cluster-binding protein [Phycisphaerae bacterium]|nr:2Fe-2S iron-sulfur cluster-binding protein [Phycisphaerae bacterium]